MSELGVLEFSFKEGDLRSGERYGVWGDRARRIRISSSCPLRGDTLIRHLAVAASCAAIEVSFIFSMISCEKSL